MIFFYTMQIAIWLENTIGICHCLDGSSVCQLFHASQYSYDSMPSGWTVPTFNWICWRFGQRFKWFERSWNTKQNSREIDGRFHQKHETLFTSERVEFWERLGIQMFSISILFSLFFSLVDEFNTLYEYIVFAFFLWTLSTIGSSLVVLQSETVEYNATKYWTSIVLLNFPKCIVFDSVFESYFKSNRDFEYVNRNYGNVLVVRHLCIFLWIWRNGDQSIQFLWRWNLPLWLVFVTNRNSENVFDIQIEHAAPENHSRLWKYFMYTRNLQRGNLNN